MFALPEAAVLSASARGFLRRNGMVMKKTYLFGAIWAVLVGVVVFVALTFALRGCSFEARNQNTYTTTMEVADFRAISVAMPAEVTYTVGPQCSVMVEADEKTLQRMDVHVDAATGTLEIGLDPEDSEHESWYEKLNLSTSKTKIAVTAPALSGIEASLSASVTCESPLVSDGELQLIASTAGEIKVGEVRCATSVIEAMTSGDIALSGLTADTARLSASTSGDIEAGKLQCDTVKATTSTSGDIEIEDGSTRYIAVESSTSGDFAGGRLIADEGRAEAFTGSDIELNVRKLSSSASTGGEITNRYGK